MHASRFELVGIQQVLFDQEISERHRSLQTSARHTGYSEARIPG
jgi:hypothetical protein